MRNKKFFAVAAAVAIALGGFTAIKVRAAAQEGRTPFRGAVIQRIIKELSLTEEQIGKIKTELRAEKETLTSQLKQLHETRKGLRETIQTGGDEKAIRAASAKVAEVEANLAVKRAKLHTKIAPILTDEQIVKVKAFEEKVDDFVIKALKVVGEKLEQ